MKKIITCIILLLGSQLLLAQLKIEYNLFNDDIVYKRGDKILTKPYINKGENVSVEILEFNPYVTKAKLIVKQSDYIQSSGDSILGNSLVKKPGNFEGIGSLLSALNLGKSVGQEYDAVPKTRGDTNKELIIQKAQFNILLNNLINLEDRINKITQKINLINSSERAIELAIIDISELKNNRNIQPTRIKELISEEIKYAFAKTSEEEVGIKDLVIQSEKSSELKVLFDRYENEIIQYKILLDQWNDYKEKWDSLDKQDELDIAFINDKIQFILSEMNLEIINQQQKNYNKENHSNINLNTLAELRRIYEENASQEFKYRFSPIQADKDKLNIELELKRKSDNDELEVFKTLSQNIPVSGSWKITGAIGLNFAKFKNETYEYVAIEDKIIANELDDFFPILTSFAHIYKYTPRSINFGASFGIGLPVLSETGIQDASFFFGPSIQIGHDQRILFSGGIMGAKTNRLSNGYEVGDSFDSFSGIPVPTREKYELGYFVGLSFNILK